MIAQPSNSDALSSKSVDEIIIKLRSLSPGQQQQVLEFVEFLAQKNQPQPPQKTIWQKIDEQMEQIPIEAWEDSPIDGSYQHEHYLYGTSKREA